MKRLWESFLATSRSRQIGISVIAFHALLLTLLFTDHLFKRTFSSAKPIAIRTHILPRITPSLSQNLPNKTPPSSMPAPNLKKNTLPPKPPSAKPSSQTAPKTPPSKPSATIEQSVLQALSPSLQALAEPVTTKRPPLATPLLVSLQDKSSPAQERPSSLSYAEACAAILQSSLDLPELGEVSLRIEISTAGIPTNVEILSTKNQKNSEFLKKRLRELAFPCFNEYDLQENHVVFTITFRNAENR